MIVLFIALGIILFAVVFLFYVRYIIAIKCLKKLEAGLDGASGALDKILETYKSSGR